MIYRMMEEADIETVVPLYIEYYNGKEDGEWTEQTTYKRIHQVFSREDSYCMVLEDDNEIIAFAMGYFEFMKELEARVKEEGAMLIQLQAVNDEFHEHFYGKLGYNNASNLVLKTKLL